ncbi:hypothetical protein [Pseudotabrizicola algicola]|uniref:Uncharacterized protein n=1 Tax=Pseudotabrizicola algicola TaxID=2709381 RepID=A0A6B3RWN0_9RHOB|nr:hypothetical protein [Pseudotabrizicola algicola]NEX48235.1 hypothetical protein [Pseudotabrizicola algicola]
MKDNDPLWLAYLWESWGLTPERQRNLQELEDEVRAEGPANRVDEFLARRTKGAKAYIAKQELEKVFSAGGEHAARQWLVDARGAWLRDRDILSSLERKVSDLIKREQNLRGRNNHPKQRSRVRTTLRDGRHPNCLRALHPADSWTVYVDETGVNFDSTERADNPNLTGRVVALAVPDGVELADCGGFHAVERSFSEVDDVLQRVLDAPVGILGFSVLDDTAQHRYWIGHVLHLVRWTLLQLPIPMDGRKSQVRILIEQRDAYSSQTDLKALAQALESELAALDPQRFKGLALKMGFMDKKHPMNGYVDVVAFTWGSSDWSNKDRLRKSQLQGHCFVKANESSLHHLYLALTRGGPLAPADWYALCAASAEEQDGSFLRRELDRLGKAMARLPRQWELYLEEVQTRLASKQYSLAALGRAIDWLEQYADQSQIIPGTLRLQLDSSNLSLANHRGQIQDELVFRCLEWVNKLEDEAPQLVAEALLRMASTMTNNFQFSALEEIVETWLAKPIAVAGLLNYGKLQSTRGQMHAFSHDPATAVSFFEAAAESFARLSDPRQVARETHQTRIYEMIARMDAVPFDADGEEASAEVGMVLDSILRLLGNREPEAISRSLSASDQERRFENHLWLRALNRFPRQMAIARAAYLGNREKWKSGSDHPWPLILAYRAWLLKDAGETEEARSHLDAAVRTCLDDDHGVTLEWMALVLSTMAQAIGVPLASSDHAEEDGLRKRLQHAPWEALAEFTAEASNGRITPARIWVHLAKCLPFNFH